MVAAAAPALNELQGKMIESLVAKGMSSDVAEMTAKGVTTLALAGVGTTAGLDTSSTATGVNVDANNRQLHVEELKLINKNATTYAKRYNLTLTEAKRQLMKQALRQVDSSWASRIKQDNAAAKNFLRDIDTNWTLAGYKPFTTSTTSFNDHKQNVEYVYEYKDNYNLIEDKGGRGSYLALYDGVATSENWKGETKQGLYRNVIRQQKLLEAETQSHAERLWSGGIAEQITMRATENGFDQSTNIGQTANANRAYGIFTSDLGVAANNNDSGSRMRPSATPNSSQLPRTTGNRTAVSNKATIGTSIDSKVKVVDRPPLDPWVAQNFKDGSYQTVITTDMVTTYRKFGGGENQAKLQGAYAATKQNAGRNETAVYPAWSNSRFEAVIQIPKNQQLSIGKVAQQPVSSTTPKYSGGADQILLPRDFPSSWVKSVRDGKTGKVYTFKEFEKAFPNQIKR